MFILHYDTHRPQKMLMTLLEFHDFVDDKAILSSKGTHQDVCISHSVEFWDKQNMPSKYAEVQTHTSPSLSIYTHCIIRMHFQDKVLRDTIISLFGGPGTPLPNRVSRKNRDL